MKIGLVSTHAWPIPSPARTGDIWVLDLAIALQRLGHDVTMFSPAGTAFKNVREIPCSHGGEKPSPLEADRACLDLHRAELLEQDVVHDISTTKYVNLWLSTSTDPVTVCTLNGGPWRELKAPRNLVTCSESQRSRVQRGATDYEGTRTPDMGGPPGLPVESCVVPLGVDTEFYCPSDYAKDDYVLWLNRWHPVKGYELAVRFARATGIKLVMAGVNPADATNDHERSCAIEAAKLAIGVSNIDFRWLPGDDPAHNTAKRELIRRAKAFLYPTQFQEPFGLGQAEALACGTPVIGLRYGSVPEMISHGLTGFVVNDDIDVIQNLDRAVQDISPDTPKMCRASALERFSRAGMALRYLTVYERCVAGEAW